MSGPAIQPVEDPRISALKHNRAQLDLKLKRLTEQAPSTSHDLDASKARVQSGMKEIDAELARLGAK